MPKCFECKTVLSSITGLKSHLKIFHKCDKYTTNYKCGEDGCFAHCTTWEQLRRHCNISHGFLANNNVNSTSSLYESADFPTVCDNSSTACDMPRDIISNVSLEHPKINLFNQKIRDYAFRLVAKLYAKPGEPRSAVQDTVDDTTEFLSSSVPVVNELVKQKLNEFNIDASIIENVSEIIGLLQNPFAGLTSEHYRLKYLVEQGYYIAPKKFTIDCCTVTKRVKKELKQKIEKVKGVIVPLRRVLKKFLELPNVFDRVLTSLQQPKSAGIIGEFVHGLHWEMKKRHFEDKIVIPLHFYYDDYEVDKDLGPHSAKLGAAYVKLACLPAEFQGSVENIFLASLFSSVDRQDFGNHRVFRRLVNELIFLQNEGIDIISNNNNVRVFFTIGLVTADNAAMHLLLGFSEGFTANYPCRFCRVHKSVMHTQCSEDPSLLRDRDQHKRDCQDANVTFSGVNGPSALQHIPYFYPTENPCADTMHDVFEGVCVYDMQHILHYLIFEKKYFDTDLFNFRLINVDYGKSISNIPVQLKERAIKDKSWRMTANEMRTLVRTFPMIIGDLVPHDDPVWHFYLLLRDIVDILLCRRVQEQVVVLLARKISEHHRLYVELFHDTLKPKHHNMVHYPTILKLSGCFPAFACDRFEANHQPAIKDARATSSRRFIAYTVAKKEQLRVANRLLKCKGLSHVLEVGPEERLSNLPFDVVPFCFIDNYQVKYINFKGTSYYKNSCVVVDSDSDGGPLFGLIKYILVNSSNNVCLVCELLHTVAFSDHFHAFNVKCSCILKSFLIENLLDYHPVLYCKNSDGDTYATLHHAL